MQTVNVKINKKNDTFYPIVISDTITSNLADIVSKSPINKAILVTNETIFEIYSQYISELISALNIKIEYCIIPDGEKYKNKEFLEKILICAYEAKLSRNDAFIALGGGVIGDMTGFAASTYLRGINFIQIPTTILAQVDSSVGGKTGINTSYGKNLLGAFYQPMAVLSDINLLKTLPEREILTGLSEVIKYGFIEKSCCGEYRDFAKFLFENKKNIIKLVPETMEEIIKTSCELKATVINIDEKENGLRSILNFGHTTGHAIEKCTKYSMFTHGEAVATGMKTAFLISYKLNKINKDYFDFATNMLDSFGLNYKIPASVSTEDIMAAMQYDKKIINQKIRFVLPVDYAQVEIFDNIEPGIIESVIKELY